MADAAPGGPLELQAVPGGTRLKLRVKPGARKAALLGIHGGALKLAVTEAPERGRANEAVLALLSETLGIPQGALEITAGLASRDKSVLVPLAAERLERRIRELLAD